jgi:hypothetical protein
MYGGRAKRNKYPAASVVAPPTYGTNLFSALESRVVRSDSELRNALTDIASQEVAEQFEVNTAPSQSYTYAPRARSVIEILGHIRLGSRLDISVPVHIVGAGLTLLYGENMDSEVIRVTSPGVWLTGLIVAPANGTASQSYGVALHGAHGFRANGCVIRGTLGGLNTLPGDDESDGIYVTSTELGTVSLDTDGSVFSNCRVGGFTLQAGSSHNRFTGNDMFSFIESSGCDYNIGSCNLLNTSPTIVGSNSLFDTTYSNAVY